MRADNRGEGGILSLMVLVTRGLDEKPGRKKAVLFMGLIGAALLFGDGMITPAISVLSAIEGLRDGAIFGAAPLGEAAALSWTATTQSIILAITALILILLFSFQYLGTAKVGRFFGPITLAWFATISVMGAVHIRDAPQILAALNPLEGMRFLLSGNAGSFVLLGAVFLAVTGGEALYADMGHFGCGPIRAGWFTIAFPALLLNYLGQGALLLQDPTAASAPFFRMVSGWMALPLVLLATAATVIASQALITGTYSLTLSAVQLGYLPRISVLHTSEHARGQIYIPLINWALMLSCLALVWAFKTSTNLAAAYGVAVTMTMFLTTVLFYFVARNLWGWAAWKIIPLCFVFGLIELTFLAGNMVKFFDGGWFPLAAAVLLLALMKTWQEGRLLVRRRLEESSISQELLIESLQRRPPIRVPGTAVFMSSSKGRSPNAFLHNLKHNRVLHERVIFLTLVVEDSPWVRPQRQVEIESLADGVWRITGHYGFMQRPHVVRLLRHCGSLGLEVNAEECTFFIGREVIVASGKLGMARWREKIFAVASKLAEQPASYFQIPVGRVIELGQQVEI
jgi:KUP system potassium uptake protein